jgi:hypothetical protein
MQAVTQLKEALKFAFDLTDVVAMRNLAYQISLTSSELAHESNNSNTKLLHNWRKEEAANLYITTYKIIESQNCYGAAVHNNDIQKRIDVLLEKINQI